MFVMSKREDIDGVEPIRCSSNFFGTLVILVPILWTPAVIFSLVYFSFFNIPLSISPYESFVFLYGIILNTDLIGAFVFSASALLGWFIYQKCKRFLIRKVIRCIYRLRRKLEIWSSRGQKCRRFFRYLCDIFRAWTPNKIRKTVDIIVSSFIIIVMSTIAVFSMNPNVVLFWQLVTMFLLVMVFLPLAVLTMLMSIPMESEDVTQKKRILLVLSCLFCSCFLIFMMSRIVIQSALNLDNQGGDLFRIWIDERNEYLLSCNREEAYGKVMVKLSILGSGINKEEVFKNDKPVQLSTISPDRIESICERLAKKE